MKAVRYLALAICLTQSCLVLANTFDISNNQLTSTNNNDVNTMAWKLPINNDTEMSYSSIKLTPMIINEPSLMMHEELVIGSLATSANKSFSWSFDSIFPSKILINSQVIFTGYATAENGSLNNFQLFASEAVSHE